MNESVPARPLPSAINARRDPALLAWLRLARVFQKVDRSTATFLRQWDLSVAQFDILAQLAAGEGMTQQELADRLLVTKGNISQLLARMEARGLLHRHPHGRALCLSLTPAGRELAARVVPVQEERVASRFAALSPDEQRQLLALLRKLDHALTGAPS